MAKVPESQHTATTATAIVRWYEGIAAGTVKPPATATHGPDAIYSNMASGARTHLGASRIGRSCDRELWYGFRWTEPAKFDGRMLRLFNTGHREEARFTDELRGIGVNLHTVDAETGKQIRFGDAFGHFGGSCDGIGQGFPEGPKTWAVVEEKTHGDKSFKKLQSEGVQKAKPEHYVQMNMYMGWADLDRALYLATNKNTDEIYSEWVHFDRDVFESHKVRADRIVKATEPPQRLSESPDYFECKWCDHKDQCHGNKPAQVNCRTCAHSTPTFGGTWACALGGDSIPDDVQRVGCGHHLFIPALLPYAEPIDGGEGYVIYRHKQNGKEFANSAGPVTEMPTYTSAELAALAPGLVADAGLEDLRTTFDAKVTK